MDKLKVTFSVAPRLNLSYVNFAAQIVSSNLIRNKKLQVKFDYIVPIENKFYKDNEKLIHRFHNLKIDKTDDKFFLHTIELIPGFYKEHVKSIDSNYVIVSLSNLSGGTNYVKHLLEAGKKVVVGGAAINFITAEKFRSVLIKDLNTSKNLVFNNLIIIRGYIDLYFDFYELIKNWKDVDISNDKVNFKSMYEADFNYLSPFYDENSFILAFLFIGCQWRKCKHCWMSIPNHSYKKNINICNIIDSRVLKKYFDICKKLYSKTNQLFIADNYISNNTINFLKETDVSNFDMLYVCTGIKELLNESYVDNLFSCNENLTLIVGFDFLNEFSLKFMNKGYTIKDFFRVLNILKKYQNKYNTKLFMKANRIIDAPMDYKWREKEEDENLKKMKKIFSEYGTYIDCRYNQMIYPGSYLDVHTSKYYLKTDNHQDKNISGAIHGLLYSLKNYSLLDEMKYFVKPFIRYDEDGQVINSRIKIKND